MSRHAAPGPVVIDVRGWFEQLPATGRAAVVLAGMALVVLVVLGAFAFADRDRAAVRLADPSNAGPLERAQARALAGPTSFPPRQRVFHGDPRALDAVILARLSGPTPPPRPRPAPPTEVLTRPIDLGRVSNDDARDLFPAVCGPDGKCARHAPAICLRGDRCCGRCPA